MTDEIPENKEEVAEIQYSEFQSVQHFCLLCFLSLGIYPFFWFYKHWRYLKDEKDPDIQPGFRALFTIFYGYSLFSTFQDYAIGHSYKNRFPMGIFFLFYIIAVLSVYLHDIFFVFAFASFVFLIPPLKMMNYFYLKEQPDHQIKEKLSSDEKIFLAIVWGIVLIALFNNN